MCCFEGENESLSSTLALGLPLVFTKQQQTDRKRVFGREFLECAELNKVLREVGLEAGITAQLLLVQRKTTHKFFTRCNPALHEIPH